MQELINKLTARVDITEEQAKKVIDVVSGFVGDKLPDPIAKPVLAALSGNEAIAGKLADGAEGALGMLGGLLGGKKDD